MYEFVLNGEKYILDDDSDYFYIPKNTNEPIGFLEYYDCEKDENI